MTNGGLEPQCTDLTAITTMATGPGITLGLRLHGDILWWRTYFVWQAFYLSTKKKPILNWRSGTIGWETSQTIGTARIAWLSSNGGSVTSSHHDLCHDRHHNFQWSHPYCLHHCQRRHHHHRKHEKPIIFLFFIPKLLFGQDPVGFGIYHWNDWDCNQLARWFS